MKKTRWVSGLVCVASILGLAGAEAGPPEKTVSRYRGLEGYATFAVDGGCASSYYTLYAIEEMSAQGPGRPDQAHYVALFYSFFDWCTGESGSGSGETTDAVIVGSGVKSLRAEATLPLEECSFDPVTWTPVCTAGVAVVELDWTATGEQATHGQSTNHLITPTFTVRSHSVGSSAFADFTGSVLVDGSDVLPGVSWEAGSLSRTREGSIEFMRY